MKKKKKNNQSKSPHLNKEIINNNKSSMEEEINSDKKEVKPILKKNNNISSEANKKVQKQNQQYQNLNNKQYEIPNYKITRKSPQTAQEYTDQYESEELQGDQIKIQVAKIFQQIAQYLDPEELNELARHANENQTFPDDTQHRLVAKNTELNQIWYSRLIQMITDEPYYVQQMMDSSKISSRDLKKKIKYGIYINAYLQYILKQNFRRQEFDVEEGVHHKIALLMLIPIVRLLKRKQVMDQSDKVNTQGLMELLYSAYSKGHKKAYKVNHIIQINTNVKKQFW